MAAKRRPEMDTRALAKAAGIAQRTAPLLAALTAQTSRLPLDIARQAVAVVEEMDLLRHYLHVATLEQAVGRPIARIEKVTPIRAKNARRAHAP